MRWRVELSREAEKQLLKFPHTVQARIERAIDEFEKKDESQWSTVKALQGPEWKGRYRKRVGDYRIIFRKFHERRGSSCDFRLSHVHVLRQPTHRREHLRELARVCQGSNVLHESRQVGNIPRIRPSAERVSRVNAEFLVLEQRVRTDDC